MKYLQVSVKVKHSEADLASLAFIECGSEGVSVTDGNDIFEALSDKSNWDYYDESLLATDRENAIIIGGYERGFDISVLKNAVESYLSRDVELITTLCDSADWENEWRKYYRPIDYGKIVIVPAWQTNTFGSRALILEPGMAFGTGNHETTGMCIKLLQQIDLRGKTVIDVGCGSGILGIAALILGSKSCTFVDNDELAVKAAKANLALNKLGGEVICGDLVSEVKNAGDVVVANITADILIRLKNDLGKVLKNCGTLILSGIIDGRKAEVINCFAQGYSLVTALREKEWNALLLSAKS